MPGAVAGATDIPLEVFGGLVTQFSPSDLPIGASPDCQDVAFSPGRVFTRPGLQNVFTPIIGFPTFNYLKTYITPSELIRTLALDSNGVLYREDVTNNPGVLGSLGNIILNNCYAKSTTLFGREFMAFSDGVNGRDIPRVWNDINLDRLSQDGPGAPPAVSDSQVIGANILASPNGLVPLVTTGLTASEIGNTVTIFGSLVNRDGSTMMQAGDQIKITASTQAGYLGTYTLLNATPTFVQFLHPLTGLLAATGVTVDWGIVQIEMTGLGTGGVQVGGTVTVENATAGLYNGIFSVRGLGTIG